MASDVVLDLSVILGVSGAMGLASWALLRLGSWEAKCHPAKYPMHGGVQSLIFFSMVGIVLTVVCFTTTEEISGIWMDVLIGLAVYSYGFAAAVVLAFASEPKEEEGRGRRPRNDEKAEDGVVTVSVIEARLPTYQEIVEEAGKRDEL